jgi:hypothetical protein
VNREDLDRWEKVCAEATDKWELGVGWDTSWCVVSDEEPWMEIEVCCPSDLEQARRNAAFIAEARTAMPALIAFTKEALALLQHVVDREKIEHHSLSRRIPEMSALLSRFEVRSFVAEIESHPPSRADELEAQAHVGALQAALQAVRVQRDEALNVADRAKELLQYNVRVCDGAGRDAPDVLERLEAALGKTS